MIEWGHERLEYLNKRRRLEKSNKRGGLKQGETQIIKWEHGTIERAQKRERMQVRKGARAREVVSAEEKINVNEV